jgi:hypothetical protein
LRTPESSTNVSWAASAANLLGALVNLSLVSFATSAAKASAKPLGALRPVPTAVPPWASWRSRGITPFDALDVGLDLGGIARKFLAEGERGGVLEVGAADLDDPVPRRGLAGEPAVEAVSAGISRPSTARAAAMCIAVGKLSFDDWPLLTWSLGWTGLLPPRVPVRISLARPAITSLAFMFDWVPEPVCQMTSGNWSSCMPWATSPAACWIASAASASRPPLLRVHPRRRLLHIARAWTISGGIVSRGPNGKFWIDRWVWAPQ